MVATAKKKTKKKKPENGDTLGYTSLLYFHSYKPHSYQEVFHKADQRIKAIIAGARGGKTLGMAMEIGAMAIFQPRYQQKDIDDKKPYTLLCVAPTYPMLQDIVIPEVLRVLPKEIHYGKGYNEQKKTLLINGRHGITKIIFRSAGDSKRGHQKIEGLQLYGAWIDEFMQVPKKFYTEVKTRLMDRKGILLLSGTPKGRNWGYQEIYKSCQIFNKDSDIFVSYYNTIDNPYFPKEELEKARAEMPPEYFTRTFEASFDAFEGQVWKAFKQSVHVIERVPKDLAIVKLYAGQDFGYPSPNATVFIGEDIKGNKYILDELYTPEQTISDLSKGIKLKAEELAKKYKVHLGKIWCDSNNNEAIKQLKNAGLFARPVSKGKGSVLEGIKTVAELFHVNPETKKPKLYILSCCVYTISECQGYQWRIKVGDIETDEPEKIDDHTPDALRYAIVMNIKGERGSF